MEPISGVAGILGTQFLTEGIKFLWNQTGKVIDRYYENKKQKGKEKHQNKSDLKQLNEPVPEFVELSRNRMINFEAVSNNIDELKKFLNVLSEYFKENKIVTPENKEILLVADKLQLLLGVVFKEELNVPRIKVEQFIEKVSEGAEVTGPKFKSIKKGDVEVKQDIGTNYGKISGPEFEEIG